MTTTSGAYPPPTPEQIEAVRWWVFLAPDDTPVLEGRARLAAVGIHDEDHARAVAQVFLARMAPTASGYSPSGAPRA